MSINITNKCPPFLSTKNFHERDSHITFDEGPHIYTIDGDSSFKSVTTFNHSFFEKFDADKVISNMMASKKWPDSQYFGMSANEIKAKWNKNGKEASAAGTKMHEDIEYYYNNSERDKQISSFKEHIEASIETNTPLIIHSRDAEKETFEILKSENKNSDLKILIIGPLALGQVMICHIVFSLF